MRLPSSASTRGRPLRRGPTALDARQQGIERLLTLRRVLHLPPTADPLERALEALFVEGLEQVVHRAHLEGLERVLIVGGDENDERQCTRVERARERKAVQRVHLDIEEQQVGRLGADRLERGPAVAIFAQQPQIGLARAELPQRAPPRELVIDDDARRASARLRDGGRCRREHVGEAAACVSPRPTGHARPARR